jgi:hypothetical protein
MKRVTLNQIPDEILNDVKLKEAMNVLPKNYNFEIPKTIWKIKSTNSKRGKQFVFCLFKLDQQLKIHFRSDKRGAFWGRDKLKNRKKVVFFH